MMLSSSFFAFLIIAFSCFSCFRYAESKLPQQEVDALQEITSMMGATYWKFDSDSCEIQMVGLTPEPPNESESIIRCDCSSENDSFCHVVSIMLKGYNLPGLLPPQLVNLPYIREVDFALNYLYGTIPKEWASLNLTSISVLVNRLSGEIPKELGNITNLIYLNLEANQFSGPVPSQLGSLSNLQTLILSSNKLSGNIPATFSQLQNLIDFRINDNSLNGKIPSFIQNWKLLQRLEMHASGLEGPIPSNISLLSNLTQLRISDINGPSQTFPILNNMKGMIRLILRSCNITGKLPSYMWTMNKLEMFDVSFNNLVGEIPATSIEGHLRFLFLTGNMLSGNVPDSILIAGSNVDLSYNNFSWQGPEQSTCQDNLNLNLNLFRSTSGVNGSQGVLPCSKTFNCPRYSTCLHVNSGGKDVTVMENDKNILYIGDGGVLGGAANYFNDNKNHWGLSSTGDFMDDSDFQNTRYTKFLTSSNMSELYETARVAPLSLTYFHYCLENGKYTVYLHFAEIQFTNDKTYKSLGKRLFDIYVQEKLVWKDFNIEDEGHAAQTPHTISIYNVSVTDNVLEIRFYWASKGTTRIPRSGVYGPLISGFSIVSDSKPCSDRKTGKHSKAVGVGLGVAALFLVLIIVGVFWWKGCFKGIMKREKGIEGQDSMTGTYTLKQIRDATDDFNPTNKIGEGGFGPVYKGQLSDGTWIAVKQLSSKSQQGNREFLNEIGMISCLQHPNLVKLHGCCIQSDQLMLVYEYMEHNSLARALFSSKYQLKLDWPTRLRICIGIAKGLAFLHEESRLKIVHRDIKATNVLLDGNLNPKISDFGLAKLDEEEKTHISTRVAGTMGYMAPEYALWGYLTYKADVYSYGVLVLEVVSGQNNNDYMPSDNCVCLLEKVCRLQHTANLMKLVDERLGSEFNPTEAENMMKVALLCTNTSPSLRPTMSGVVNMLEGRITIPDVIQESGSFSEDLRFKAMRDIRQHRESHSLSTSRTDNSTGARTLSSPSTYGNDIHEISSEL
ncbi:PREDICTED: probable LRR receptor-like serine/threonine-protein kinase RFK1 isoform X1 [Lupinus angustifolius]|uniref:probable LRR receptor-like serine/threonine-protein kinase RFK1 isoform X1 n=1 Tax=Lupinus angustifolius TaxID=3871 RepID=UPI00092F1D23|nr:PREDICTED: probable LRR receptor-like serine/threonine-protein kinase RFK1 isoform X1 [Lupinus angustifolius]XP_019461312.1 PREDICTED: probable LRR receptor-like serine/threonine-protein kinase RFK1 isoform X1 [Lupinus angustifolius]